MGGLTVLHVPHSADVIPADLQDTFVASADQLTHERLVSTDWYTDELFALPPSAAAVVRFPVSRLVLDPERFLDDGDEPLAARGRGVIYTHTADGRPLRTPPSPEERATLIARFYTPHHARLSAAVQAAMDEQGACLLVDCHSFPSEPLLCDLDQTPHRPDICLGTDPRHTPPWLVDLARDRGEAAGFTVTIDRPYAGALVPADSSTDGRGVLCAIMVEVNRRLYMHEGTGAKRAAFPHVSSVVQDMLLALAGEVASRAVRQPPTRHGSRG